MRADETGMRAELLILSIPGVVLEPEEKRNECGLRQTLYQ